MANAQRIHLTFLVEPDDNETFQIDVDQFDVLQNGDTIVSAPLTCAGLTIGSTQIVASKNSGALARQANVPVRGFTAGVDSIALLLVTTNGGTVKQYNIKFSCGG